MELACWDVDNSLRYRWSYSWKEIIRFYKRKQTIYAERKKIDFDFISELAIACMGGSKSDEISLDSGDGIENVSDDQEVALRAMLGEDYDKIYGV